MDDVPIFCPFCKGYGEYHPTIWCERHQRIECTVQHALEKEEPETFFVEEEGLD